MMQDGTQGFMPQELTIMTDVTPQYNRYTVASNQRQHCHEASHYDRHTVTVHAPVLEFYSKRGVNY